MPLFTRENAKEMARRSNIAQQYNRERAKLALLNPPPPPAPLPQPAADPYLSQRLSRVRSQLDRIDEMIATETDPQKLDRLASAQARIAEQERLLCERPLPGSRRPSSAATSASPTPTAFGPADEPG